jgi:hypothetical protein
MIHATDNKRETKQQKRQAWNQNNKAKLAEYARKHYHRKVNEDPEYRKMLSERAKMNRLKRREQLTN